MKWVSNLPDSEHTPYPVIEEEPHVKKVISYFRPSDWLSVAAWGTAFPAAFYIWELKSPSIHPRLMPRVLAVQVPFFISAGILYSMQNTYFRFWGWKENKRELERFEAEGGLDAPEWKSRNRPGKWSDVDW